MKILKLRNNVLSKKISILGVVLTSVMTVSNNIYAYEAGSYNPSAYLGIDVVYSNMKFKKDYGSNIFAKSAPGVNIFVGSMFNNIIGAEVGYEVEKKHKKNVVISGPAYVAGWLMSTLHQNVSFASEIKQRHPYLGVVAKVNLDNNFFIAGLLGVSVSHINAKYTLTTVNNSVENATFSKTKPVAMARLSVGYSITDKVDVRAYTTWRNTSRFKIESQENTSGNLIKLRDNFNVGLGFVYNIV